MWIALLVKFTCHGIEVTSVHLMSSFRCSFVSSISPLFSSCIRPPIPDLSAILQFSMHSITFVAALAGSALALRSTALSSTHPAVPTIAANASASFNVSRGLTRRQAASVNDPCAVQPSGTGPAVVPDTPEEFVAHGAFQVSSDHTTT